MNDTPSPKALMIDLDSSMRLCQQKSAELLYFSMDQHSTRTKNEVDTYGHFWMLAHVELTQGELAYVTDRVHALNAGPTYFFVPPLSVIEWRIAPGRLKWTALVSAAPVPEALAKHAVCFTSARNTALHTAEDIFRFVSEASKTQIVSKQVKPETSASRIKNVIDLAIQSH
jgi:hypothetical protein